MDYCLNLGAYLPKNLELYWEKIKYKSLDEQIKIVKNDISNGLSAEYWYLLGILYDLAGEFSEAFRAFEKAEPHLKEKVFTYYPNYPRHYRREGFSLCDIACGACLLDTCCECMGGDFISCC
ncbi:tetratricopeptide repeat protein [Carboxydothermus pertinax]|uniref:Tetratricopeptide repeat protein n=1 Tax=Carboxydothermus pertinax TaxID=870242 RepID=A0A1L8CU88_9THEO|nr:tetratricopeptide repeat protein [Carboxydothermus pertinax]GAV22505.1 hypothetical protein cpu_10150 [Carboxydothermus pertinax]